jgi:hypothetical protein
MKGCSRTDHGQLEWPRAAAINQELCPQAGPVRVVARDDQDIQVGGRSETTQRGRTMHIDADQVGDPGAADPRDALCLRGPPLPVHSSTRFCHDVPPTGFEPVLPP